MKPHSSANAVRDDRVLPVFDSQIQGLEWGWLASILSVLLALTLALASFAIPWDHSAVSLPYWADLRGWMIRVLATLILLFNLYIFYQQRRVHRLRAQLDERDRFFRLIAENAPDLIAVVDMNSRRLYNSPSYEKVLGYRPEELMGTLGLEQIHPEDHQRILAAAEKARMGGQGERVHYRMRHKDGSWRTLESTACAIPNVGGRSDKLIIINRDITEQTRAQELLVHNEALRRAEEKYRMLFEDAVVGILQISPTGRPLDVNRTLSYMFGYASREEFMGEVSDVFSQSFVIPAQVAELQRVLSGKNVVHGLEMDVQCKDGSSKCVLANFRPVIDTNGEIVLYEGTLEDITHRKAAEQRAQYLAYYDALTGLANRTLLQDRLEKALAGSRRRKEKVAVMFLDLDRFKQINDSFGHAFGDLLLKQVATRLKNQSREQDTIARVSGDEFMIVLCGVKDMTDVAIVAERIMDVMTPDFEIESQSLNVNCSLGISIFPDHGCDVETLIKNADAAMYVAKESGRNNLRLFSQEMNVQGVERLALEQGLRHALDNGELFLMYQPQVDIESGAIVGLEALLRWRHPKLGIVMPDKFIRIAENSGLILPIGAWVLRTACFQLQKWHIEKLCTVPVAVNVSAVQFRQQGFRELISQVLTDTGLAAHYLELELTESLLLSNADVMSSFLRDLKNMGVRLTIDDFGTGYSSLSYLRKFPFSKLKIDRSFIRDAAVNADDAAIATAIVSLARTLGLKVIAEGVESEAQIEFLRGLHCDEIQGYYFSRPLTVEEVSTKLKEMSQQKACHAGAP